MNRNEDTRELPRVQAHEKRRCPTCQSNRWEWLGAAPVALEELAQYFLVKYRCRTCGVEFLVEEAKGTKLVKKAEKCVFCGSRKLQMTSKPGADIELWLCEQCNGYMGIERQS